MSEGNETTIPELREAAERGKEARQEAEQLRRENAFLKAGIDPESPRAKYFVKGYDGELTAEAIKSEAEAAGIFEAPAKAEAPKEEGPSRREPTPEEAAMDDLSTAVPSEAASPGEPPAVDELKEGWEKFAERRKAGDRLEDAGSEVISRIIAGAVAGDERFISK